MKKDKIKAIGLLSGGLDSTLSHKIIFDQGVDVHAINCYTGFCISEHRRVIRRKKKGVVPRNESLRAAADIGVPVELVDISDEYLKIVANPRYGYGSAINPCLDCRIHMLTIAKEYMNKTGAHFVFTGEVLGQRPMSQYKNALRLVEKQSGLDGYLLRPLSAKLLPETIPEKNGWIDRERLYAIQGRSRKEQMALAEKFSITDYPQPAGGCCFLTDKNYARKFRDLVCHKNKENLTMDDMLLLKAGRHFRLNDKIKFIIGRDESENKFLERMKGDKWVLQSTNFKGPVALIEGNPNSDEIWLIASIVSRYSDGKDSPLVDIRCEKNELIQSLHVKPVDKKVVNKWRI